MCKIAQDANPADLMTKAVGAKVLAKHLHTMGFSRPT